jgi:hypothetical protein
MSAIEVCGLQPPPRPVPWSAVASHGAWLLWLGLALMAGGFAWLGCAGADLASILAEPGPRAGDAAAALPVGAGVLPGLLCVGWWLRSALRWKVWLANAASARVELEFQQRLACSVPSRILASYRYRDGSGAVHAGRRTVLATSPEGRCLWLAGGRGLVAMYDQGQPDRSHLVAADRFADS